MKNATETARKFLNAHGFETQLDVKNLAKDIQNDMNCGILGEKSYQDMIKTYLDPTSIKFCDKSVVVIDAGGTNFRSCKVTFSKDGSSKIEGFEKTTMPAINETLTAKEFFDRVAQKIERFKDSISEICFCFSYAMEITEDLDGILLGFSKEIKVYDAKGVKIGDELKRALKENGWKTIPRVVLLNDTVSALLSGIDGKKYSSFIGFILGTGLNCAFVQPAVEKIGFKRQIVVCESAKFGKIERSEFDKKIDEESAHPGLAPFEKMCSGAYLGTLGKIAIQTAAKDGLFSAEFSKKIDSIENLSLKELSEFLENSDAENGKFAQFFGANEEDSKIVFAIFDEIVDRSARISAALLGAAIFQCAGGQNESAPVKIACNGTTFFKTYKVAERTKTYLDTIIDGKRYYKIMNCEADITIGTALVCLR